MFKPKFISLRTARRYAKRHGGSLTHRDVNGYRLLLDRYKQPVRFLKASASLIGGRIHHG